MVRISSAGLLSFYLANAKTAVTIAKVKDTPSVDQHHRREDQLSGVLDLPYLGEQTFTAQPSEILGVNVVDHTPDYHDYLPYIYVVFGSKGHPHVRAIIEPEDDCPEALYPHDGHDANAKNLEAIYDGSSSMPSVEYYLSDPSKMPYRFPVKLCGLTISPATPIYLKEIQTGNMKLSFKDQTYDVPQVKFNPSKFLLLGDTGMRIKVSMIYSVLYFHETKMLTSLLVP